MLSSAPVQVLTHPVSAAVLNVGGLWVLYTTGVHMLAAGYLFTAALIGTDPDPHRAGYRTRAVVLVAALAGHDILAKTLYAIPPAGVTVPQAQAQAGAQLMYYGGDAIDLIVITIFCYRWYRHTRPRTAPRAVTT
ncbi:cytochrome c oxidase assembly factor CtaG [Arthrobacter sp. CG_A4]|nr:cytochrome c oxidase assembly factor CtaG [Arthrobacter sp. CG_A4]